MVTVAVVVADCMGLDESVTATVKVVVSVTVAEALAVVSLVIATAGLAVHWML